MIPYPKIETLYNRDPKTFKVIPGELRLPEFGLIKQWHVTEKIDGMSGRISLSPDGTVDFSGRTNNSQLPPAVITYAISTFTASKLRATFPTTDALTTLYGEFYGEKIQNGGAYRKGVSFRLFDVLVGEWWLEPDDIADVAGKLGIYVTPVLAKRLSHFPESAGDLQVLFGGSYATGQSCVADLEGTGRQAEGIVARTVPMLFTRRGDRLCWKLKFRDF